MKKVKQLLMSIGVLSLFLLPGVAATNLALAEDLDIGGRICTGVEIQNPDGTTQCQEDGEGGLAGLVKKIINIFSWVVGVVAVIMIIIAGFKYITSGGNDSQVASAKNTILYAIVGLVIVALAQVIVRFVLNNITDSA